MPKQTSLAKMIEDYGPALLFDTEEGLKFTTGAIYQMRASARVALAMIFSPELREKIPEHIKVDVLKQSAAITEQVGQLTLLASMLKQKSRGVLDQEQQEKFQRIFVGIYTKAAKAEDELARLCDLTMEVYSPNDYSALKVKNGVN